MFIAWDRTVQERRRIAAADEKIAAELLASERVLIEKQAGQEAEDKAFAKKMQLKENKALLTAVDKVLKLW